MKSLNKLNKLDKFISQLDINNFDVAYETDMVQTRILSPILEVIERKNLTQSELEDLTGLKQPFISALFNNRRKLNMEHIALFQNALNIVLQPPSYLSMEDHITKFYTPVEYYPFESDQEILIGNYINNIKGIDLATIHTHLNKKDACINYTSTSNDTRSQQRGKNSRELENKYAF